IITMTALKEEVEECMDTSDTPWYWYYLADCGRWHRFEVTLIIFFRSLSFVSCVVSSTLSSFVAVPQDDPSFPIRSENIDICYLRDSKSSLNVSTLISVCLSYVFKLIELNNSSPEYQTVADYVTHDGLLNKSTVSISRIQNLDLWEMYCRKKQQLMRIKGVKEIPERRLFHGTDSKNVDSICKYNFDLRIPKKTGRIYGNGVYFAVHASYADNYSTNRAGTPKKIFLARVMVGKFKRGQSDLLKPDHENVYDSCVDDADHPKVFVIFDPNQIYPEYLIEYQ
uniref:Poly [ADP-ribose] polymerase n=1 Tax=Fundulus heteroclitus TaxID=8078 RepID=A0A3Q2Q0Y3_FUNHE